MFKSAFCNKSNIIKSDKIPIDLLKPEYEIAFYNDEYEEKKIIVKTDELQNDISQTINIPKIDNLPIKISYEEVENNDFINY